MTEEFDTAPDQIEDGDKRDYVLAYLEDQPLTSLIIAFLAGLFVGRIVL